MSKQCFKCGKVKPLREFYRHPQMADRHLNKCKECTKQDVRENRAQKREYYSTYEKQRFSTQRRKEQSLKAQRRRRLAEPHKDKARQMVNKAIRNGSLSSSPCAFCGSTKTEAHHEDYNKPFDVIWVCFKCHRERFHGQTVVSAQE